MIRVFTTLALAALIALPTAALAQTAKPSLMNPASLSEQARYYDKHLRELIAAGQEEGDLDAAVDARRASLFIWAAFTGLPDWFRPGRVRAEDVAADYVGLALRAAGGWHEQRPATPRRTHP